MVYVPGGTFEMGSTEAEIDAAVRLCNRYYSGCGRSMFSSEGPVHRVTLREFWMDRTEVTAAQYAAFLNRLGADAPSGFPWFDLSDEFASLEWDGERFVARPGRASHPASQVEWEGAQAYCNSVGGRLPTEAEWEYAARGPQALSYPWGDDLGEAPMNFCDRSCGLPQADVSFDDGYVRTSPVGSYPEGASWCGALDMAGNVWEWVADWYQEDYYTGVPQSDPTGPAAGRHRGLRGGSWFDIPSFTRGANRYWDEPTDSDLVFGFRCVVTGDSVPEEPY
jgi:formylglycine-generating enzyme required for sulfatase activity